MCESESDITRRSVITTTTVIGLCSLWLGHWYWIGRHFVTTMMALLCLYLFHSGGVQNTGPLYYGVLPSVALFLQGRLRGFVWVIVLLVLTCIPEYFRLKAKRDLLLSINDLEALTYCDLSIRLANRSFLEKILHTEFGRHQRYGTACCWCCRRSRSREPGHWLHVCWQR